MKLARYEELKKMVDSRPGTPEVPKDRAIAGADLGEVLTDDDRTALRTIAAESDDRTRVHLLMGYWHDLDRANRTPRSIAYLHLGVLMGICDRLLEAQSQEI